MATSVHHICRSWLQIFCFKGIFPKQNLIRLNMSQVIYNINNI